MKEEAPINVDANIAAVISDSAKRLSDIAATSDKIDPLDEGDEGDIMGMSFGTNANPFYVETPRENADIENADIEKLKLASKLLGNVILMNTELGNTLDKIIEDTTPKKSEVFWKFFRVFYQLCLAFYSAFTVTKLWDWFVVTWINAPKIPFVIALGLMVLFRLITFTVTLTDMHTVLENRHDQKYLTRLGDAAIYSYFIVVTASLVTGWIIHLFV